MPEIALILISVIGGYALGSIPFGLVLTWVAGYGDIRSIGSGNIGATNVLRTGNKPLALATLLLDAGKGAVAVLIAGAMLGTEAALLAGCAALLGHLFPIWLSFKGGKGVATTLGTCLALAWPIGAIACAGWLVTALSFRISSLAAIIAMIAIAAAGFILAPTLPMALAFAAIALIVIAKHHANIRRLINGTEPKIGQKNAPKGQSLPS